jgi:hypothetical protein
MKFAVITLPYSMDGDRGTAAGPDALLQAGLADWLREQGHNVGGPFHVKLTPDEEAAYGAWNKIGFANAHLARLISEAAQAQAFPLVLQSNCFGFPGRGNAAHEPGQNKRAPVRVTDRLGGIELLVYFSVITILVVSRTDRR